MEHIKFTMHKTGDHMSKMRAIQVSKAKGKLELVERDIPNPTTGTVRVKVEACRVCHLSLVKNIEIP